MNDDIFNDPQKGAIRSTNAVCGVMLLGSSDGKAFNIRHAESFVAGHWSVANQLDRIFQPKTDVVWYKDDRVRGECLAFARFVRIEYTTMNGVECSRGDFASRSRGSIS